MNGVRVGLTRRLTELLLGPLVIRRRLPAESGGGAIVVSGKVGGMRYLFKPASQWDPDLVDVARLLIRKGNVVWDIGSNVGLFSKVAAYHAGREGRIVSIEPDEDAVTLLERTCRLHSHMHAPIAVLRAAVSDSPGLVRFAIARRARAANSIEGFGTTQTGGVAEVRLVQCVSLDELLERYSPPDFVKIDVEAAELKVLNGGTRLLRDVRPIIHCEVAAETRLGVSQLLKGQAYKIFDAAGIARGTRTEVASATDNTVAIPCERVGEVLEWR